MSNRLLTPPILALLAAGVAGCGSSKAPGVTLAPSAGATRASAPASSTTATQTTATQTTPTATTPKPPSPLSKKPVVTVPKGSPPTKLVVNDLIKGTGAAAKAASKVTVNYVGVLYSNGAEFDSSWKHGQTFAFQLTQGPGGVIPGWVQGVPGMKVGGRRELIVPPSLAYGKNGSPPSVPPNATLVFVIDLLAVS